MEVSVEPRSMTSLMIMLSFYKILFMDWTLRRSTVSLSLRLANSDIVGLRKKPNVSVLRVHPVAVTGSPNLLCCILRYFSDFAFCCCVI